MKVASLFLAVFVLCLSGLVQAATHVSVVPFTALLSPGAQDVVGDMGGALPKGAVVVLSGGTNLYSVRTHARLSLGFYDGTAQYFGAMQDEDGSTDQTDNDCWQDDSAVGAVINLDRTLQCTFVASFVTNGVKLTQAQGCTSAWQGAVLLLGGTDVSFKVGSFNGAGALGASVTVTPGFRAEWGMFFKTRMDNFTDAGRSSAIMAHSLFINHPTDGVKNFGFSHGSTNNLSVSESYARVQNNAFWELDVGSPGVAANEGQHTAHTFTATTFQVRNDDTADASPHMYVAVSSGGTLDFHAELYDTPAAANAGPTPETSPGFVPSLSLFLMSLVSPTNSTVAVEDGAGAKGIALYDGTTAFSASACSQDNVGISNAKSVASDDVRLLGVDGADTPSGCQMRVRATPSHGAAGTDLDFLDNPSISRKWIYFALAGGSPPPLTPDGRRRGGFIW